MPNALIVVAKRPMPGQTKTRLSPPLSADEAAQLYERFLLDTLDLMRCVKDAKPILAYLPEDADNYFRRLSPGFDLMPQQGNDLGQRLDNTFAHCLSHGFGQVVIMDSDSPTLPAEFVAEAFKALDAADVVLGPCDDGGYYLIGLKRPAPRLLREVQMSTPNVVRDTLALAAEAGLTVSQLPTWYDVDTAAELVRLYTELATLPANRAKYTRAFLATQ